MEGKQSQPVQPVIVISTTITQPWLDKLSRSFAIDYVDRRQLDCSLSNDALIAKLADAHVLITELDQVDAAVMEQAPNLAVIIDCRAAPVNIDVTAATERGIAVINTPGRNSNAVADLTIALMVMALRRVDEAMKTLRANRWVELGMVQAYIAHHGREMPGKTVGLVGLGAVGRKVAQRLSGFDVQILGYDPYVAPGQVASLGVEVVDLPHLLSASDIVSLHAPVTDATRSMIDPEAFGMMKPTAYLVNTARAALVDEDAMMAALQNGQIAGVALDVFHREPLDANEPLMRLPNVIALPHIGGATHEVVEHQSRLAYAGLVGLLKGELLNVVNPKVLPQVQARLAKLNLQLSH